MDTLATPDNASAEFYADRYAAYRTLRDHFPFLRTEIDGESCLMLTRYADVDEALRNPAITVQPEPGKFPDRVGRGPAARHYRESLPSLDPPEHTRIRRIITPAFAPRAVAKMRAWIEEAIERHLDNLEGAAEVDFVGAFASPLAAEIGCRLVHIPVEDGKELLSRSQALIAVLGVSSMAAGALEAADAAARFYQEYVNDLLDSLTGKTLPEDDFLGVLLASEGKEGGMTRSETVTTVTGFIIAAYHTSKATITNATLALLRHPDQKARLVAQPELARPAWEEALRYDGPVHFMHRYASRPITIGSDTVEPGQRLLLGLQAANRDERRFPNPDRFIIDREDTRHFGYAGGPHFCIGAQMARLEGELLLSRLFRRFPRLRAHEVQPDPLRDLSFPMLMRLNVSIR